ncbi:MAG: ABC transporter ATP-binding protein [Nautiliaceae bacterium]
MFEVRDLVVKYNGIPVLKGINLEVRRGEIVTLLGPNGSGKSTLVKAIFNLVEEKEGKILFFEEDITHLPPYDIVRKGISIVPEGRRVFVNLTVEENLKMGGFFNDPNYEELLADVYYTFPRLEEKRDEYAGNLSGGEQQMLAIGRAMMSDPILIVLDEPSLGLAPKILIEVFNGLLKISERRQISMLLIEQNAQIGIRFADYIYILDHGKIVLEGLPEDLVLNPEVKRKYFGM